tara:strand:+ start:827 stop:2128 length:1302 start_codon:yes stop_codon:yes gene_type:complete
MTKRYVLDTNVYLTNYQSIYSYEDGDIIIPLKVLEEIDKHKKRQDSVGYNARQTIRALDELRELGNLCEGVTLPDSTGRIIARSFDAQDIPSELDSTDADNQIISTALTCVRESEAPLIVVTRDINMRVKCDALGLKTEDYEPDKVVDSSEDLYKGILDVKLSDEDIDNFYSGNNVYLEQDNLLPNQYLMLTSKDDEKKTALARFSKAGLPLKKIFDATQVWGVNARNREQQFAMDALMNPDIPLVSLVGKAGTGKTICAISAGLQQVMERSTRTYNRLIISRPVQPMGKDIGFLPGTMEEKMLPWLMPIQDNLKNLLGDDKANVEMYMEKGLIEIEALTYIRGRSISKAFVIIDEAQNLTPHEIKTIITRVGEETKIILIGDVEQIDNVYINETSNGLAYAIERMKDSELSSHVSFTKGERSRLATLASKVL